MWNFFEFNCILDKDLELLDEAGLSKYIKPRPQSDPMKPKITQGALPPEGAPQSGFVDDSQTVSPPAGIGAAPIADGSDDIDSRRNEPRNPAGNRERNRAERERNRATVGSKGTAKNSKFTANNLLGSTESGNAVLKLKSAINSATKQNNGQPIAWDQNMNAILPDGAPPVKKSTTIDQLMNTKMTMPVDAWGNQEGKTREQLPILFSVSQKNEVEASDISYKDGKARFLVLIDDKFYPTIKGAVEGKNSEGALPRDAREKELPRTSDMRDTLSQLGGSYNTAQGEKLGVSGIKDPLQGAGEAAEVAKIMHKNLPSVPDGWMDPIQMINALLKSNGLNNLTSVNKKAFNLLRKVNSEGEYGVFKRQKSTGRIKVDKNVVRGWKAFDQELEDLGKPVADPDREKNQAADNGRQSFVGSQGGGAETEVAPEAAPEAEQRSGPKSKAARGMVDAIQTGNAAGLQDILSAMSAKGQNHERIIPVVDAEIQKWIAEQRIKRAIFVKDRLINFVT